MNLMQYRENITIPQNLHQNKVFTKIDKIGNRPFLDLSGNENFPFVKMLDGKIVPCQVQKVKWHINRTSLSCAKTAISRQSNRG